jgi:hypothetical protein
MKTKVFYIAITTVLSLTTLNAFADGTKGKKQSSEKKNATVTHLLTSVKEVEMEMESWMTSLNEFNTKSEIIIDEPLQFEDWMMRDFNGAAKNENFKEEELVMEDWMMNDFNTINHTTENFQDDELILEGWMLESFDVKTQEIFTCVEF